MIDTVEAVDGSTVKFTLSTPFADMPLQLMDYRIRMIPEGSGDTIATTGIGTGPFKLVKFDAEGVTKLVANMDYYEGSGEFKQTKKKKFKAVRKALMKASTRIQQYLSILHFPEILTDSELRYVTGCTREKFEELINEVDGDPDPKARHRVFSKESSWLW